MIIIDWCNANSGFIMAVLTAVYVIATIFIWCSNKRAAEAAVEQTKALQKQIEQMEKEQANSRQPFLYINDATVVIEHPRFFYTPPVDEYKFGIRYFLECDIRNLTDEPAIGIQVMAKLLVEHNNRKQELYAFADELNVVEGRVASNNGKASLLYNSDDECILIQALRQKSRMIAEVAILYKAISGGYFLGEGLYYITLDEESRTKIKDWDIYLAMIQAKYRDEPEKLRNLAENGHSEKWEETFQKIKQEMENEIGKSDIRIALKPLRGCFNFKVIDEEIYKKKIEENDYKAATNVENEKFS